MSDRIKTHLKFHCDSIVDISHSNDMEVILNGVTFDSLAESLGDALNAYQVDTAAVSDMIVSLLVHLDDDELGNIQLAIQEQFRERSS